MRRTVRLGVLTLASLVAGCATAPGTAGRGLGAEERLDLAVAYLGRGDHRGAVGEAERALARRPGWPRALRVLGDGRLGAGDVEGAIAAYEAALRERPEDPETTNNLAWALLQHERRWPEAEPLVLRALAASPELRGYYLDTLGLALLRRGDGGGALSAFRAALAGDRSLPAAVRARVLDHAAEAHARLGDESTAARCRRLAMWSAGDPALAPTPTVGPEAPLC